MDNLKLYGGEYKIQSQKVWRKDATGDWIRSSKSPQRLLQDIATQLGRKLCCNKKF